MEKSKAQVKREKQLRESLVNRIGNLLIDFQDRYLGASVEWEVKKLRNKVRGYEEMIKNEPARIEEANRMIREEGVNRYRAQNYDLTRAYEHNIKKINTTLSREWLLNLESINEAKKGYDFKFNRMIDKLMYHDFTNSDVKVEFVRSSGYELEFLVSNKEIECHARAIFVCGEIKAPHYRFITTIRTIK